MSSTRKILVVGLVLVSVACHSAPPPGYVSSADFGAKWPLTVSEGVLECTTRPSGFSVPVKAVTFKTNDGHVYAVNGAAKGRKIPPIDPILKLAPIRYDGKPVERLSEPERKAIFAENADCESESDKARAKYPNDIKRATNLAVRLENECKSALKKRRNLTQKEHDAIAEEGVDLGWPPFDPPRMDSRPLIERGLKLCGS